MLVTRPPGVAAYNYYTVYKYIIEITLKTKAVLDVFNYCLQID